MNEPFYKKSRSYLLCGLAGVLGVICLVLAIFLDSVTAIVKVDTRMVEGASLMDSVKYGFYALKEGFAIKKIIPLVLLIILFIVLLIMLIYTFKDNFLNENYHKFQKIETGKMPIPTATATVEDGTSNTEAADDAAAKPDEKKKTSFFEDKFGNTKIYRFNKNHRHISRMISIVIAFLIFIALYHTSCYKSVYANATSIVDSWKSIIAQYQVAGLNADMSAKAYFGIAKILMIVGFILYIGSFCLNFILDTLNEEQ